MALLLVLQCHAEVAHHVVRMSDCLVACAHLEVHLAIQLHVAVEGIFEAGDALVELFSILIHQAHVQLDRADVRVVVSADSLQDLDGSLHRRKSFGVVLTRVVVQAEVGVAVSDSRVIEAKDLLLDDDSLGLQLDGLDAVAVLVLDVSHLG